MADAAAKRRRRQRRNADRSADREANAAGAARSRAFWAGTLSFGLVSIPVDLYPANRTRSTPLRSLGPDGTPLSRRYYEPETGREVPSADVQRGFEVETGRFVVVEDEELETLAPEKSRDIDLQRFVPLEQLDPLFFQRAYFLAPAGSSTRAYRLLAAVMEDSGRAGIATFVMRGHEYLVAILAQRGILRAETLRFSDEVRTPESIGLPELQKPKAASVRRMAKSIDALHADRLDPDELRDQQSAELVALAHEKLERGEDLVEVDTETERGEPGAEIVDLMSVLKSSLSQAEARRGRGGRARRRAAEDSGGDRSSLEQRSKSELYERARELDIEGRSKMSKEELIEALIEALKSAA